jgi:hypothetical protein
MNRPTALPESEYKATMPPGVLGVVLDYRSAVDRHPNFCGCNHPVWSRHLPERVGQV